MLTGHRPNQKIKIIKNIVLVWSRVGFVQAWVKANTKFGCESPGGLGCEFKFSSRLRSGANLCAKFDVKSIANFGAKFLLNLVAKFAKFAKFSAKFAAKSAAKFAAKTWSLTFYDYIPYVKFSAPVSATVSAPVPAAVVGLGAGPWPGPAPVP